MILARFFGSFQIFNQTDLLTVSLTEREQPRNSIRLAKSAIARKTQPNKMGVLG